MAFNFWEAQRRARSQTALYLSVFALLTVVVAVLSDVMLRAAVPDSYHPPIPYFGLLVLGMTTLVALLQYASFQAQGGSAVAEALGGRQVFRDSSNFNERQLYNIVEEVALAAGLPIPAVYILPAGEINAFAAGLRSDRAALAITFGALEILNREEIQGVIAHEFGHIYNGDMRISMRLAAMLMGFFFLLTIGFRILRFSAMAGQRRDRNGGKGGNPVLVAAMILICAGVLTWFFGSVLRATVSRQREYLADACAVQFTRNANGIANALRKIAQNQVHDLPNSGVAFSHLYLDNRSFFGALFATHPPLSKRIEALEGRTYIPEEWKAAADHDRTPK